MRQYLSSDSRSKAEVILSRRTVTDEPWDRIGPLLPRGRTGADNHLFIDAVLWLTRAPRLGATATGVGTGAQASSKRSKESSADPDFEHVLIDATSQKGA